MARPKVKCDICGYRANSPRGLKAHMTRIHDSGKYVSDLQAENRALAAENETLRERLRSIRKLATR